MEQEIENVNVAIRIRPRNEKKKENVESSGSIRIISKKPPVLFAVDRAQTYYFDNVFMEEANQETVFNETVKPLVAYVKQGYDCTVFAYGQTGTGKSYTIGTDPQVKNEDKLGLIPRTLKQFFELDDQSEVEISVSFIEIYNEKVFDLLQNNSKQPLSVQGFKPQGFYQEKVFNVFDAKHFLEMGNKNRHVSGTKQNAKSSRSHAIFTIYCNVRHRDTQTVAKMNLVDLAGSESVKKTGNQGSTFQEGVNINRGLLAISQVMTALSTNSNFVPYRQSIITSVLQDSLNRNNYVSLIACVSDLTEDSANTCQTLDFAHRVKKVKGKPEINEIVSKFKQENPTLFQSSIGTPLKRPLSMYQTPAKRSKLAILSTISEPSSNSIISEPESQKSSFSISEVSSCSSSKTDTDVIQQTMLSPLIKRYMTQMESSLMDKLELVIKSTLKRPNRVSLLAKEGQVENEAGTPSMSWNKIQNEVSKIVRNEFAQLTSNQSKRATSSPIGDLRGPRSSIRKVLSYDSPLNESIAENNTQTDTSITQSTEETCFKVPEIPILVNKNKKAKCIPSISPIENVTVIAKRSARLALKKTGNFNNSALEDFEQASTNEIPNDISITSADLFDARQRRCSMRLLQKQNEEERVTKRGTSNTRGPNKNTKLSVAVTPAGKRLMKNHNKDSPSTLHTIEVLELLNRGNIKQLETLHSIGVKTAQQVVLFRKIKGPMVKISDLSEIPGWGGKKFERFVEGNFLKQELL